MKNKVVSEKSETPKCRMFAMGKYSDFCKLVQKRLAILRKLRYIVTVKICIFAEYD